MIFTRNLWPPWTTSPVDTALCPYCISPSPLLQYYDAALDDQKYRCQQCEGQFVREPDGSLEAHYDFADEPSGLSSLIGASAMEYHPPTSFLCKACSNHQSIIVQLLAAFEPSTETAFEQESVEYRRQLERRYPLCQACQYAVEERLRQLSFKLRCGRVSGQHAATRQLHMASRRSMNIIFLSRRIHLVLDLMVQSHLMWSIVKSTKNQQFMGCILAAIMLMTGFILRRRDFGHVLTLFSLAFLRSALWYEHWTGRFQIPRQYLCGLGALGFLLCTVRINLRRRAQSNTVLGGIRKVQTPITSPQNTSFAGRENIRPNTFKPQSPSASPALHTMSIDGLSLGTPTAPKPTTPRNPFEAPLPRHVNPPSAAFPRLRPTALPMGSNADGLEDMFGRVNLQRRAEKNANQSSHDLTEYFRQLALSGLLVVLRLWARDRLALVAVIFSANFILGHYFLLRLPGLFKYLLLALAVARLFWLGVEAATPEAIPGHRQLQLVAVLCDSLVFLFR